VRRGGKKSEKGEMERRKKRKEERWLERRGEKKRKEVGCEGDVIYIYCAIRIESVIVSG
jgi:hypothetical protein